MVDNALVAVKVFDCKRHGKEEIETELRAYAILDSGGGSGRRYVSTAKTRLWTWSEQLQMFRTALLCVHWSLRGIRVHIILPHVFGGVFTARGVFSVHTLRQHAYVRAACPGRCL